MAYLTEKQSCLKKLKNKIKWKIMRATIEEMRLQNFFLFADHKGVCSRVITFDALKFSILSVHSFIFQKRLWL
jgi:hypothetical protein